ncbi:hypothetical protein MKW98_010677 [Papaver atlanticum]|uniref:Uncharacterized protein n=1 Tax=Papaver atlanticum TaxID=357466 RepID=A0AAD4XEE4_9MAGN|nr:hypothetical protein MKW98_010677 [Papaver atlanticum]
MSTYSHDENMEPDSFLEQLMALKSHHGRTMEESMILEQHMEIVAYMKKNQAFTPNCIVYTFQRGVYPKA